MNIPAGIVPSIGASIISALGFAATWGALHNDVSNQKADSAAQRALLAEHSVKIAIQETKLDNLITGKQEIQEQLRRMEAKQDSVQDALEKRQR